MLLPSVGGSLGKAVDSLREPPPLQLTNGPAFTGTPMAARGSVRIAPMASKGYVRTSATAIR